jgi:hypothetical protein
MTASTESTRGGFGRRTKTLVLSAMIACLGVFAFAGPAKAAPASMDLTNGQLNLGFAVEEPPVCPEFTTGIPPDCEPIPCPEGFEGNEPNCVKLQAKITKVKVMGPKKIWAGRKYNYKVKIKNGGNATAENVSLKVRGPGVKYSSGDRTCCNIGAGKSLTIRHNLRRWTKGKVTVKWKVTSNNAGSKTVKKKIKFITAEASTKTIDSYCSPSGDFCQGVFREGGRIKLKMSQFPLRGKYQLCVKPPRQAQSCNKFRWRKKKMGVYRSGVDFATYYPSKQKGLYKVRWRSSGSKIGKTMRFRKR